MKTLINLILFAILIPMIILALCSEDSEDDIIRDKLHPL